MTEDDWNALRDAALAARDSAYAPYSRYYVGAALRTREGSIVAGANVENASYGLTVCAERSAVFAAIAKGDRMFDALVVVTSSDPPAMPCGACRQVLSEFPPSFPIRAYGVSGGFLSTDVASLLPHAFGPGDLER